MSDLIEEAAKAICCPPDGVCEGSLSPRIWCCKEDRYEEARAVFSRLDALGYAVVPKEPTPEMVEAGSYERDIEGASAEAVYRAMLAAKEGPK